MLVGLDTIEWTTLNDAYGSAEHIPQALQAMETASNEMFSEIFSDFVNSVHHQGTLYEVTPFVIPFLVQLIDMSNNDERKAHYLIFLSNLAEKAERPPKNTAQIEDYHEGFQIYDAFERTSLDLLRLSRHDDPDIKILSLYILSYISGIEAQASQALQQAVETSNDDLIQIVAIWGYARVVSGDHIDTSLVQLRVWAESDRAFIVRAAATLGYIFLSRFAPESLAALPETIASLLIRIFEIDMFALLKEASNQSVISYNILFSDFTPFEGDDFIDARLTTIWLMIVRRGKMTPQMSFSCVRTLLDGVFNNFNDDNQHIQIVQKYKAPAKLPDLLSKLIGHVAPSILYEYPTERTRLGGSRRFSDGYEENRIWSHAPSPHKLGTPFTDLQRQALDAVLACEAFWRVKTNLLSFFYGLPDDREELRALLTASS